MTSKSNFTKRINLLRPSFFLCSLLSLTFSIGACSSNEVKPVQPQIEFTKKEKDNAFRLSSLPQNPVSPTNKYADDPKAIQLGHFLFFDTRLSKNNKVSCATCHQPEKGWSDGLKVSKGVASVTRNAPTLWNLAHNDWYFWDGRADSIWMQAGGPLEAPAEMGYTRLQLAHLIEADASLKKAYIAIFGAYPALSDKKRFPKKGMPVPDDESDPLQVAWASMKKADQKVINRIFVNITKAIAAYERQLISKNSPFDRFIDGWKNSDKEKIKALNASAQRGLKIFVGKGQCTLCHHGPNFTDNEFHNVGLGLNSELPADSGRFKGVKDVKTHPFNGIGEYSDAPKHSINIKLKYLIRQSNNIGEFKTPTLRNIEQSAPYMHDGRFQSLEEVISFYSKLDQTASIGHREESLVPLKLSKTSQSDLLAFLKSLTGTIAQKKYLKPTASPLLK